MRGLKTFKVPVFVQKMVVQEAIYDPAFVMYYLSLLRMFDGNSPRAAISGAR